MTSKKSFDLEKTLSDLEQIVEELEDGQLSLEDAMKRFEEGVKLTRICQKTRSLVSNLSLQWPGAAEKFV